MQQKAYCKLLTHLLKWLSGHLNSPIVEAVPTLKGSAYHSVGAASENTHSALCFNVGHGMVSSNLLVIYWSALAEV